MTTTTAEDFQLIDTPTAAKLLYVSPAHLANMRSLGTSPLPYIRVGRGAIRYRLSDIVAYVEANTVAAAA